MGELGLLDVLGEHLLEVATILQKVAPPRIHLARPTYDHTAIIDSLSSAHHLPHLCATYSLCLPGPWSWIDTRAVAVLPAISKLQLQYQNHNSLPSSDLAKTVTAVIPTPCTYEEGVTNHTDLAKVSFN